VISYVHGADTHLTDTLTSHARSQQHSSHLASSRLISFWTDFAVIGRHRGELGRFTAHDRHNVSERNRVHVSPDTITGRGALRADILLSFAAAMRPFAKFCRTLVITIRPRRTCRKPTKSRARSVGRSIYQSVGNDGEFCLARVAVWGGGSGGPN